jgi:hypothetical protein
MINRRLMTVPPALPRAAISAQRLPKQANDFSHLRLETANMRAVCSDRPIAGNSR